MKKLVIALIMWLSLGSLSLVQAQWASHHNMTAQTYQQKFDSYKKKGYRLVYVDGYHIGSKVRYAAIWRKVGGPAYITHHGMSSSYYQQCFNAYKKKGYRLVLVDGAGGSKATYSAIWEKKTGPAYMARHGLTSAQYQKVFDEYTKKGYTLSYVSGFGVGSSMRYACIMEKKSAPSWVARHGLKPATYQSEFNKWTKKGFRLIHTNAGSFDGGGERFACIFQKSRGGAWVARHGLSSSAYQAEFDKWTKKGYRLTRVSGYERNGKSHFAAIWVK